MQQQARNPPWSEHLDGRFLHDAVQVGRSFTTSDELLRRIHTLINRAMLSNMFSVLSDGPDEERWVGPRPKTDLLTLLLLWLDQSSATLCSLIRYPLKRLDRRPVCWIQGQR